MCSFGSNFMLIPSKFQDLSKVFIFDKKNKVCLFPSEFVLCIYTTYFSKYDAYVNTCKCLGNRKINFFSKTQTFAKM